jgi:hypothetical protein
MPRASANPLPKMGNLAVDLDRLPQERMTLIFGMNNGLAVALISLVAVPFDTRRSYRRER